MQRLDAMLSVCETAACRRILLLKHFGEESEPCGHYDNCLHPPVRFDDTVLVQKLLSCVYRAGQRFAAGYITNLLRGKSDDRIQRSGHDKLPTSGIGSEQTGKEWRSIIRRYINLGYLTVNIEQHQALQLAEAARKVLKGEIEVMLRPLRREKTATQKPKDDWLRIEREERLWQALRQWRQQRTRAEEVSAYMVCGDKTLYDIVEKMPRSLEDLHQIYGLGKAKINKFGLEIPDVCEAAEAGTVSTDSTQVTHSLGEREQALEQALETWREQQASADQVTLDTIFSNESMGDLLINTPAEPIDLLGVYKFGEKHIEQYGEGILNICRPFSDGLSEEDKRKRRLTRRLLQWNTDTARHEGPEAYQICSKVTLHAIAARRPQDLAELAEIHGMSEEKTGKYGAGIVELCKQAD